MIKMKNDKMAKTIILRKERIMNEESKYYDSIESITNNYPTDLKKSTLKSLSLDNIINHMNMVEQLKYISFYNNYCVLKEFF